MASAKTPTAKPAPAVSPTRRMFPLVIQAMVDLDGIREQKDLDAYVEAIGRMARETLFRELVKRGPPAEPATEAAVPGAPARTEG